MISRGKDSVNSSVNKEKREEIAWGIKHLLCKLTVWISRTHVSANHIKAHTHSKYEARLVMVVYASNPKRGRRINAVNSRPAGQHNKFQTSQSYSVQKKKKKKIYI